MIMSGCRTISSRQPLIYFHTLTDKKELAATARSDIQQICQQIARAKTEVLKTLVSPNYVENLKAEYYCIELVYDKEIIVFNEFPKLIKAQKILIPLYEWGKSERALEPNFVFFIGSEEYSSPAYNVQSTAALRDSLFSLLQASSSKP